MASSKVDILQNVIQVANDSKSFYESALMEVKSPIVKQVFQRMATAKGELISKLSGKVIARGEQPESGGTIVGGIRKAYADLLATIGSDNEATYAAQLEETEDRLLKYFDEALQKTDSMDVRAILLEELPKVRACHNEMKHLKTSLAA